MSEEKVFGEIPDGRGNVIRVLTQVHKGKTRFHIRRYWMPDGAADWIPTKIGLTFNEDGVRELSAAIDEARRVLEW